MKEKVFSFILGGVLGFLMVCSMIAAFDYVCDLRDAETETETQTQTPAGVEYIFGIATSKNIYYETYDMIITTADGTEWIVYDYICPLGSVVELTVYNGRVLSAEATTYLTGGEKHEG